MNAYLVLPLIQALFSSVLIVVVLKGHFRSFTHRLFSLFLLSLAMWGIIIFGMRASPDIEYAYSWDRWVIGLVEKPSWNAFRKAEACVLSALTLPFFNRPSTLTTPAMGSS